MSYNSQEKIKEKVKAEVVKLIKELGKCQKEKDEYLVGWKRERANFLNYKKDELQRIREAENLIKRELILKVLDVLDSFDRAESGISQGMLDNQVIQGFLKIKTQLENFLDQQGVREIECREGGRFNPAFCDAVQTVETNSREKNGTIEQVIQRGYEMEGELLRPVKVKVFKKRSQ